MCLQYVFRIAEILLVAPVKNYHLDYIGSKYSYLDFPDYNFQHSRVQIIR